MRTLLGSIIAVSLAAIGCMPSSGLDRRVPAASGDRAVLFVGNSHTYVHDVPGLVEALAHLAGDSEFEAHHISAPDFALIDHLALGQAQRALTESQWRWVVLQQGPSAVPENQPLLEAWTRDFEPYIRGAGAEPVLYQIWPMQSRRFDADAALTSYWNAAYAVNGILAPAGDAFTASLAANPAIPVYDADGLHASLYGAYLSALVILERLTAVHPESLPPQLPGYSVDSTVLRHLQRAAATALDRNPRRPTSRRNAGSGGPRDP